nr:MAG TPA: Protein of unknown function (DUF551) [Caudoviricetes sp.]
MNVLEKILEEMENESKLAHEEMRRCARGNPLQFDEVKGYARAMEYVVDTIRSHMDEVSGMRGKRLIDANALNEEVRNFRLTITGDPSQSTVVRECKESFRRMIDEQPTVYEASDWIPVDEKLPESDGFYLATLDGEICGQEEAFTGLAEFEHGKWIDDEEGYKCVLAWQPLPEPYKGGKE